MVSSTYEYEDEHHIVMKCPRYDKARAELVAGLSSQSQTTLASAVDETSELHALFGSSVREDWIALA
eukprot:7551135-Karenia_brevis.AAC.1